MTHGPPRTLQARGVTVTFPGVRALDGVDFDVHEGEVHALIGENGAGKSTLVRVLTGEVAGYAGEVWLDGARRQWGSPRDALGAGIAVIPQELQLVRSLTTAENIVLGREPRTQAGLVDRRRARADAHEQLGALGEGGLDPDRLLGSLDAGHQQLVAIARALSLRARFLIMDEPTTSLGAAEAARLERIVRRLAERGVGVVYISHRLDEVRRLAQRITVLRDGKHVTTCPASGVSEDHMVRLMVGREILRVSLAPVAADAPEVIRVERLSLRDGERPGGYLLRDVSFAVRRGEIVGLAGLVGAGRTDLLRALVGDDARERSGSVRVDGRRANVSHPPGARAEGIVLLPEERKAQAIFPHLALRANVTVGALERVSRFGMVDRGRERERVVELTRLTGVRAPSLEVPIATLSGGNQQKALLARCLFAEPRVLLLDEPTRGVDVAAKGEIYGLLRELASRGFGIVMASSEMSEILTQCHRVVVFREGRVTAEFQHEEATEERVLAAAAGTGVDPASSTPDATGTGGAEAPSGARPRSRRRRLWSRYAQLGGLVAVFALAAVFSPVRGGRPVFLDIGNLTDILRQVSEKGILAVGMTAVIITGGIDLSVGSVLALAATLAASLLMDGASLTSTLLLCVVVGAAWGAVNGAVVARWRLQPFIVTLATMSAARGVARYLSGGTAIPLGFGPDGAPESVHKLAGQVLPHVPAPALLFVASVLAMHVLLTRTRSGRYLYAIGDNETAARLSGVRVAWHKAWVYVLSGALAALAGVVHCAQLEQGNPNDGVAYELDAIAAVVIGGTSLSGGVGTVAGTLVGVLIIGIINNGMGLNNVDANLQLILKGAIILAAVLLQRRAR